MPSPTVHVLEDAPYDGIRREIESYARQCGYYIIGFASLSQFRRQSASQDSIVDAIYDHFDDDPRPVDPSNVPQDQSWDDYERSPDIARDHAIKVLVGGGPIGYTVDVMSSATAGKRFDQFVLLCGENPRFYLGLGLGDQEYVYQHGVLVVADRVAGLLWVVESD